MDISAAGVCLTFPEPLHVGSSYELGLRIENDPSTDTVVIGRVCFCIEQSNGYRVGMSCSLADFVRNRLEPEP